MELAFITIRFNTPGEQLFVEDWVACSVWEREVWKEHDLYQSWTEFDISGCEAGDLVRFEEAAQAWDELSDKAKEVWEKKAAKPK